MIFRKENDSELKVYPLTNSQKTLCYAGMIMHSKNTFDICAMIHIDGAVDENIMMQAVICALLRQKSTCMRLKRVSGKLMQYFYNGAPEDILYCDFSCKSQTEYEHAIESWRDEKVKQLTDRQLYFIRLLRKPNGTFGLFFRVSHYCFDAYALLSLGTDLLKVYDIMLKGEKLPPLKSLPLKNIEEDEKYETSQQRQTDIAFWNDEFLSSEPLYASTDKEQKYRINGTRYGQMVVIGKMQAQLANYLIPAETAQKIVEFAKGMKVSPQCMFMLAIGAYLSGVNDGQEDITVFSTVARRGTLSQKRAGGCRINSVPFRISIPGSCTLKQALYDIYSRQAQYFAHSALPTYEILKLMHKKYNVPPTMGYYSVAFIYQPYGITVPEGMNVRCTFHSGLEINVPLCLTVMPQDDTGNLYCNYIYQYNTVNRSTPQKLHNFIYSALEAMIDNPDITVKELINGNNK